jgi:ATP-dependent Clp endopeptidase proteolytic subunit ClpP
MPNFRIRLAAKKTAEIFLYDVIGQDWFGGITAKQFSEELKAAGDISTIKLRINSPGGDVFDGLAIYNQLVRHPAKVEADVDGEAASIASIILMAANKIRIADNAMVMIHDPWSFAVGSADDMREKAALLDSVKTNLVRTYAARTGQAEDVVSEWMSLETWMDAATAKERGFADVITEPLRAAAVVRDQVQWFRHVPQARRRSEQASARAAMAGAKIHELGQRLQRL